MSINYDAVDLFAGPGGWDVPAKRLGLRVLGIEMDPAACATRKAAGLNTVKSDVLAVDPAQFIGTPGLIASPPCQTFSTAGGGSGRKALDKVLAAIDEMTEGRDPWESIEVDDPRTKLVLEPLRWALAMHPRWIAWEQVTPVLPVWERCADVLRSRGYAVVTGNLNAEEYGVPQTRKRAILLARLDVFPTFDAHVHLPEPTHTRYRKGKARQEGDLLPWVSMADALGWADVTVVSNYGTGGDPSNRGERTDAEPSATVTSKIDRFQLRNNTSQNAAVRDEGEPAPTMYFGQRLNKMTWEQGQEWVHERPSTTVVGSFRPDIQAAPGYRKAGDGPRQNAPGSVRVTVEQAAVLQSFSADYPWQGTRTKQYQQVGNAIPPLLAERVLLAALGLPQRTAVEDWHAAGFDRLERGETA